MYEFATDVIAQQYDSKTDAIVMCGDYNIPSFEMPKTFENTLMNSSPAFAPSIKGLNKEYESVLMHKVT
mgnify:CR=1 FL=1